MAKGFKAYKNYKKNFYEKHKRPGTEESQEEGAPADAKPAFWDPAKYLNKTYEQIDGGSKGMIAKSIGSERNKIIMLTILSNKKEMRYTITPTDLTKHYKEIVEVKDEKAS